MQSDTIKPITGLRTIGIPVTDQDRAVAFYAADTRVRAHPRRPHRGRGPLGGGETPGTNVSLALECAREGHPAGVETGIRLTTHDADAAHAALRSRGVDADGVLRWPGVPPMFAFRDQDGNGLEIVEA